MLIERPYDRSPKPDAIRRLYEVFARYVARRNMPRWGMTQEEIDHLCVTPLTDLTPGNLAEYVVHAVTTVGEAADFKHFLPRVLELLYWGQETTDPEVLIGKLSYSDWHQWPDAEQEAVHEFLLAWWKHILSRDPTALEFRVTIDSCLSAIGLAEDDLAPFLDYWRSRDDANPLRHLAAMVDTNYDALMRHGRLGNSWLRERRKQMGQIQKWLLSPQTGEALERAFFAHSDAPFAQELSQAHEQHRWLRKYVLRSQT